MSGMNWCVKLRGEGESERVWERKKERGLTV